MISITQTHTTGVLWYSGDVDSHDLFTTWYDGQGNVVPGTGDAYYNKPVIVTQEMVDHGHFMSRQFTSQVCPSFMMV